MTDLLCFEHRQALAKEFGATETVNSGEPDWKDQVMALVDGLDIDVEAVGMPETFTMATVLVGPGGNIAYIGVHGRSVDLAVDEL
jgi:alcohol dehydrogenase